MKLAKVSNSQTEEIISAIWAVCAVLCFGFGFTIMAWVFTVKAVSDTGWAIYLAVLEVLSKHRKETTK